MPRVYVDSNVIIIGRMIEESNSRLILEATEAKVIQTVISEDTLKEVTEFFRRNFGKTEAATVRYYVLMMLDGEIVWRHSYERDIEQCKQDISDSDDAPHLAAALKAKPDFIVSTNRHFLEGVKKIRVLTPKEAIETLGLKGYKTYY